MNRAASEESSATGEFTSLPGDVSPGTASHSPLSFTRPGNSSQPSEPSEPTVHSRPSSAQVQPTPRGSQRLGSQCSGDTDPFDRRGP